MKWISVKDRLPEQNEPILGFCFIENESLEWRGIVQVFFDREVGWKRCELHDDTPVRVLFWTKDFEKPR